MSNATLTSDVHIAPEAAATPRFTTRAATAADLDLIHTELLAVIDESPHYNAEFKAYEKSRLTKTYLRMLQREDPWHVMALISDGKVGGALISGPEFGAVFRYWSWIFPPFRKTRLGMHGMRAFDEHFEGSEHARAVHERTSGKHSVAFAFGGESGDSDFHAGLEVPATKSTRVHST